MSLLLVAEQDERGRLAWVWYWRPGLRGPRPLRSRDDVAGELAEAEVHGATREEIVAWIDARLSRTAPPDGR